MSEPTCRTCYALSLPYDTRMRFLTEEITMPVHYCAKHDVSAMLDHIVDWSKVQQRGCTTTGRIYRPWDGLEPQFPKEGTKICEHDECCDYYLCAHPKCCGYHIPRRTK